MVLLHGRVWTIYNQGIFIRVLAAGRRLQGALYIAETREVGLHALADEERAGLRARRRRNKQATRLPHIDHQITPPLTCTATIKTKQ